LRELKRVKAHSRKIWSFNGDLQDSGQGVLKETSYKKEKDRRESTTASSRACGVYKGKE